MDKGYGVATLVSQALTGDSALVSSRLSGDVSSISSRLSGDISSISPRLFGDISSISSQLQGNARLLTFKDRYLRLLDNVSRRLKDKYGKLLYASKKQ